MATNKPPASGGALDEEGDWTARQFFTPDELRLSPEEYAARHAHLLGCFSLHLYRYRDPGLGAWVRRVGEILATEGEVERCQERFLTPDELATLRKQQTEGF